MLTRIFSNFILIIFLVSCGSTSNDFVLTSQEPARGKKGMVVSENEVASRVGFEILKNGGSAIDAAVAVGFALAVTYPEAGNIGGGGFMVIHFSNGENTSIDFRETAPAKAHRDMFLDQNGNFKPELSTEGWTSSGIPGTVAGLIYALEKYGTKSLSEVIQPAIDLADNGFEVDYKLAEKLKIYSEKFNKYPATKNIFSKNGAPLKEGEILIQKSLAKTLSLIKENGSDGFYKGETAELIAEQSNKNGGYISIQDLENYKPFEREPILSTYKDYKIITMPPSSSGGIALSEALNILENFSFEKDEWNSGRYVHTVSEILKYVYADRSEHLGDEQFFNVPRKNMLSKEYAETIAGKIHNHATPSIDISPSDFTYYESGETTHYNVFDSRGNAVSVTYTLNSLFGNKIIVEGAGFFMNNQMDDFSSQPGMPNQYGLIGSEANSIQPGKRMLSSMTPVIVLKNNKPYLLLGGRGGSKIITSVMQTFLNVVEFGMNIKKAIEVPRFHHQWYPDRIDYNEFALSKDVKENLISRGQNIGVVEGLAKVTGILIDDNGIMWGAYDPRGEGKAIGY